VLRRRVAPPKGPAAQERVHERDLVAICGLAAVAALFARDPGRVERLFFAPRLAPGLAAARHVLGQARKPYREVGDDELARIAGTVRHGGVVAITRPRPVPPFEATLAAGWARDGRTLLILDGIGNPHNLGAIVRSAAYLGVECVILAERPEQALPSAASYRVAEGALDRVALYRAALPGSLAALRRAGYLVVGSALGRGTKLRDFHSERPVALVLGNEERGIDPATLALCDAIITIPGSGAVQSLSVAAAAAVLLYGLTSS
jgi:TrmH RNA methyltransferase